ncbi:hypothetical protein [Anianabacter salinae]|uniref:hypothetical protein n=1 Tax=Anianabacter salinae TaxID=2851023 RepID=UPI00225DDFDD|nr:hypothetical protein [Anianabacter salinae]MBV0913002.1 hypothetical protein [Anianabacter salinae]
MSNDWIIDVLADLRSYARQNGLPSLALHLDDAALVAAAEIATSERKAPHLAIVNAGQTGTVSARPGRCARS